MCDENVPWNVLNKNGLYTFLAQMLREKAMMEKVLSITIFCIYVVINVL